jgi:hypothetical protein
MPAHSPEADAEKSRLYEQIGKLQVENDWLKKKYQDYQNRHGKK